MISIFGKAFVAAALVLSGSTASAVSVQTGPYFIPFQALDSEVFESSGTLDTIIDAYSVYPNHVLTICSTKSQLHSVIRKTKRNQMRVRLFPKA